MVIRLAVSMPRPWVFVATARRLRRLSTWPNAPAGPPRPPPLTVSHAHTRTPEDSDGYLCIGRLSALLADSAGAPVTARPRRASPGPCRRSGSAGAATAASASVLRRVGHGKPSNLGRVDQRAHRDAQTRQDPPRRQRHGHALPAPQVSQRRPLPPRRVGDTYADRALDGKQLFHSPVIPRPHPPRPASSSPSAAPRRALGVAAWLDSGDSDDRAAFRSHSSPSFVWTGLSPGRVGSCGTAGAVSNDVSGRSVAAMVLFGPSRRDVDAPAVMGRDSEAWSCSVVAATRPVPRASDDRGTSTTAGAFSERVSGSLLAATLFPSVFPEA